MSERPGETSHILYKMPTGPLPTPPPPAPPALGPGVKQGVWLILGALAIAGLSWLVVGGGNQPPPFASKPVPAYTLPLDAGTPVDAEIAFLKKRVDGHPGRVVEQNLLAEAYLRKAHESGDETWLELARAAANQSLAGVSTANPEAELVLVQLLMAFHDFPAASSRLEAIAKANPQASVEALRAAIALAQGRLLSAVTGYEKIVRAMPTSGALVNLGLARAAKGDEVGAESALRQSIKREQAGDRLISADARAWLGRLWMRRGRLDEARALFREALRIWPGHIGTTSLLAELESRAGHTHEATVGWTEAAKLRHDLGPELALARLAKREGKDAEAEQVWKAAEADLRKQAKDGHLAHRRDLARLLLDRGAPADLAEAETLLEAERQAREDAETLELHAAALIRLAKLDAAQETLDKRRATGPEDAAYLMTAGALAAARGEVEEAERLYSQADTYDPSYRHDVGACAALPLKRP